MRILIVLSLFDGISCGQVALERAGVKVDRYFASEIDNHAVKVTQHNYPGTEQIGDVTGVIGKGLPKIDLLIGGSPCQGFSRAGKRRGLKDPRSHLFFEFSRLLKECAPAYFLLENVRMPKPCQDVITGCLGVEPQMINSKALSKQNRPRLYWTNIPIDPITAKDGCDFNNYLYRLGHGYIKDEIRYFNKYPSLAKGSPGTKYRIVTNLDGARQALLKGDLRALRRGEVLTKQATPEECEDFQTLPPGYTGCLCKTHRYAVIGNGWTVDVVAHIFKGMKEE